MSSAASSISGSVPGVRFAARSSSEVARATSASLSRAGGRSAIACPSSREARAVQDHREPHAAAAERRDETDPCRHRHHGAMEEILPGVWHWTAMHPRIHVRVSSFYLSDRRVALDPLLPGEGIEWFADGGGPTDILLTNRHHGRHPGSYVERYGSTVHCSRNGLHELDARPARSRRSTSATSCRAGCRPRDGRDLPDESAIVFGDLRAVALADGVIRMQQDKGPLAFVPDFLFDDPEKDKAGLRAAYRRLLDEHEFDHLLLAHGGAVLGDGREQLARFVADN